MNRIVPCVLLAASIAGLFGPWIVRGDEPPRSRAPLKHLYVPAEAPDQWPAGPWVPVPSSRLRHVLDADSPAPADVWIQEAHYLATYQEPGVLAGRMTADLKTRRSAESQPSHLVPWGDANLASTELIWPAAAANLGISPGGETFLIVPRGEARLSGAWSRTGRALTDGRLFEFRIPPATISTMTLEIPRDMVLRTAADIRVARGPSENAAFDRWRIEFGSRTSLQILILEERSVESSANSDFYFQLNTSFAFSRDEFRVRQEILLEAPEAPLRSLTLSIPDRVNIRQVSLGNATLTDWTLSERSPRELTIPFPDPVQGLSRPLTIVGALAAGRDERIELTEPRPVRGIPLSEQVTLNILAPLELRTIEADGYRQVNVLGDRGNSHSLIYQRISPTQRITALVGLPPNLARVEQATQLELRTAPISAQCDLFWKMSSGETYQLALRLAAGWGIESLQLITSEEQQTAVSLDWHVQEQLADGSRRLGVELPQALNPDQPQHLHLELRRSSANLAGPIAAPIVIPLDAQLEQNCLALSRAPELPLPAELLEREVDAEDIPVSLRASRSLKEVELNAGRYRIFSFGDEPATGAIPTEAAPRAEARWKTTVDLSESGTIAERIECRLPNDPLQLERFQFSLPLPADQWSWSVDDGTAREFDFTTVESTAANSARQAYEVRATPPLTPASRLIGVRRVKFEAGFRAGLPAPIDDAPFVGEVELIDPDEQLEAASAAIVLGTRGMTFEAEPQSPGDVTAAYSALDAELRFEMDAALANSPREVRGFMKSIVRRQSAWELQHTLELILPATGDELQIQIPEELTIEEARLDDRPVDLAWTTAGNAIQLPAGVPGARRTLLLRYRTPIETDLRDFKLEFPLPQVEEIPLQLQWSLALPSDWELISPPAGVLIHTPQWRPTWTERLFGSLGRSASEGLFNPLRRDDWNWDYFAGVSDRRADAVPSPEVPADWVSWNVTIDADQSRISLRGWSRGRYQRLAWAAFFASLSLGVLLRRFRHRSRAGIGALWLAGVTALLVLVPDRWVECVGSLLIGSLIAALLPRSLIFGRLQKAPSGSAAQIPTGSTVTRHPALGAILILALLATAGWAQPSPSSPGPPRNAAIEVLVPYTNFPPPADLPEVVYLREADHQRLFPPGEAAEADLLLLSADYNCRVSAEGVVRVESRFEYLLADSSLARLKLPLRGANLAGDDPCRVNGVAAAATIDERGEFVVLLPQRPASNPSDPPVSVEDSTFRRISVELSLYPPVSAEQQDRFFDLSLPVAPVNRIAATLSNASETELYLRGPDGESLGRGPSIDVRLGRTESVRLGWRPVSAGPNPSATKPSLDVTALISAEARLSYMVYRVRAQHSTTSGPIQELDWNIPPTWSLRSLDAPGVLQHRLYRRAQGARRLIFDLKSPLAADTPPLVIEATFLCPTIAGDEDELTCSFPDLFDVGVETPLYQKGTQQVRVGIWSPPDLLLSPFELPSDRLRLFSTEEFQTLWPSAAQLQTPRFSYEVQQLPVEASYLYTTTRPRRQLKGVQVKGVFERETLDWNWTGEVQTTETPAFQHEFRIDPRMEILSLSVKEDRAERVSRWSVQDSRLTILLNRKTEGRQLIEIRGRIPLEPTDRFSIPMVRLLNAEQTTADLELLTSGDWSVGLPAVPENLLRPEERIPTAGDELQPVARYQLSERDLASELQLTRTEYQIKARRTSTLRRRSDERFSLTVTFDLTTTENENLLRWRIPAEYADEFSYVAEKLELESHAAPNGAKLLETRTVVPAGETRVEIRATLTPPQRGNWTIPLPELDGVTLTRDRLECRTVDGWLPLSLKRDETVARDPETAVPLAPTGELQVDVVGDKLILGPAESVRREIVPKIPLILTWARIDVAQPLSGTWYLLYEGTGLSELRLTSSAAIAPLGCRIDGRPAAVDYDQETSELEVSLSTEAGTALIAVDWKAVQPLTGMALEQIALPTLSIAGLEIEQRECLVVYDTKLREVMHQGIDPGSLSAQQARLLVAIHRIYQRTAASDSNSVAAQQLAAWHSDLQAALATIPRQTIVAELTQRQLAADEIDQILDEPRLSPTDPKGISTAPPIPGLAGQLPLPNHRIIVASAAPTGEPRLWFVEDKELRWLGAAVLLILGIPFFRWLMRLQSGEWLDRHRPVAWLLLGLLWWCGFRLGAWGAVLVFASALVWLTSSSRTPPRRLSVTNQLR